MRGTSVHRAFTAQGHLLSKETEEAAMTGLALMMFIGLFAFGRQLLGWSDTGGEVQLGLFMSFIFGIICGYRTRG
jgi:hypothetical protein